MSEPGLEKEFRNCESLANWLRYNAPWDLMIAPDKGVTVGMLIERLDEIASDEWNDSIDAMGEDA